MSEAFVTHGLSIVPGSQEQNYQLLDSLIDPLIRIFNVGFFHVERGFLRMPMGFSWIPCPQASFWIPGLRARVDPVCEGQTFSR